MENKNLKTYYHYTLKDNVFSIQKCCKKLIVAMDYVLST